MQKEAKKPRECIEQATIRNIAGEVCIPPVAFKKGMISASVAIKGMRKTHLRIQMFIKGNSIPVEYNQMVPRMDIVRTAGISRAPDVRFRPMFEDWSARLVISFNELLQPETVLDLLNRAGDIGVGEWRPEKDGTFGTYRVSNVITDAKTVNDIREACAVPLVPLIIPDWAMDVEIDPEVLERIATSQPTDQEVAA